MKKILENLHEVLFYCFLLTFPFSVRKIFYALPLKGEFNEYTSIMIYVSDVFLLLTLIFFSLLILYNNKYNKSSKLFQIKQFFSNNLLFRFILFFIIFILLSAISVFSAEIKPLALFRFAKLVAFFGMFIYLILNVSRETFKQNLLKLLVFSGVIHAVFGIFQFFMQKSIGLFWLNESLIATNLPSVAKIIIFGQKIVRSYGLFPHPNVFAGFLLFSIILTFAYYKMFHVKHLVKKTSIVPRGTIIVGLQIFALLLTFSKSAILGFGLFILFQLLMEKRKVNNVSRETFKPFFRKLKWIYVILLISATLLLSNFFDFQTAIIQPLQERQVFMDVSRETILHNLYTGVGIGHFVHNEAFFSYITESWMLQPVHNIFILIMSESGVLAGLIMVYLISLLFHVKQLKRKPIFTGLILALIPAMLLDHYLWDIHQGQAVFWITLGLLFDGE